MIARCLDDPDGAWRDAWVCEWVISPVPDWLYASIRMRATARTLEDGQLQVRRRIREEWITPKNGDVIIQHEDDLGYEVRPLDEVELRYGLDADDFYGTYEKMKENERDEERTALYWLGYVTDLLRDQPVRRCRLIRSPIGHRIGVVAGFGVCEFEVDELETHATNDAAAKFVQDRMDRCWAQAHFNPIKITDLEDER